MGVASKIYLSKPGGQREGPFTIEQINQALAARKYLDTEYWAWHEGLSEWVPLYNLPGVSTKDAPAAPVPPAAAMQSAAAANKPQGSPPTQAPAAGSAVAAAPAQPPKAEPAASGLKGPASGEVAAVASTPSPPPQPKPEQEQAPIHPQLSSGMPFAALEHIFLFTTGDGPTAAQSPEVARMLAVIVGVDQEAVRPNVPRDVVGQCAVGELLKADGSISDAVWHAMGAHQPALVKQARERLYRVCVRTFRIEADAVVALVLFYNKQKL